MSDAAGRPSLRAAESPEPWTSWPEPIAVWVRTPPSSSWPWVTCPATTTASTVVTAAAAIPVNARPLPLLPLSATSAGGVGVSAGCGVRARGAKASPPATEPPDVPTSAKASTYACRGPEPFAGAGAGR